MDDQHVEQVSQFKY